MKESICGANCAECPSKEVCPGCAETNGCPFGKQCYIAKYILTGGMENYQTFKNALLKSTLLTGRDPIGIIILSY